MLAIAFLDFLGRSNNAQINFLIIGAFFCNIY